MTGLATIFGFFFGLRITKHFSRDRSLSVALFCISIFEFSFSLSPFRILFISTTSAILLGCLHKLISHLRLNLRLRNDLATFVDAVLMGCLSGASMRTSQEKALQMLSPTTKNIFLKCKKNFDDDPNKNFVLRYRFLVEFFQDLRRIEDSQTHLIDQIRALQSQIRLETFFRHKSGQVTALPRLQSLIIFVLFAAFWSYSLLFADHSGWNWLLFASLFAQISGILILEVLRRTLKWKT